VAHFQLFGSGNAWEGRSGEAAALYSSAAYLTEIANDLAGIGRELESIEALIPSTAAERLREARWALSNLYLSTFGTYELAASRYELLCGLQGASGVADPPFWEPSWTPPPATVALDFRRSGGNSSKHSCPLLSSLGAARCPLFLPALPVARVLVPDVEELPPTPAGPVGAVDGFAPEISVAAAVEVLLWPALEPGYNACSDFYCSRPGAQRLDRH
jgi:hypothetical protein